MLQQTQVFFSTKVFLGLLLPAAASALLLVLRIVADHFVAVANRNVKVEPPGHSSTSNDSTASTVAAEGGRACVSSSDESGRLRRALVVL